MHTRGSMHKGYAFSDRFAASLMTRNHGTVMSLNYDALCPGGGEDARGRKRGVRHEDEKRRGIRLKEEERRIPLLCNTHRGYRCIVTLLLPRPFSLHGIYELTRNPDSPRDGRLLSPSCALSLSLPCIHKLNLSLSSLILYASSCFSILIRLCSSAVLSFSLFLPVPFSFFSFFVFLRITTSI